MAFKFAKAIARKYSEISQPNPLRWEVLWKDEVGTFHPQTGKMKCKDFFNDLVSKIMVGKEVAIYGFDTSTCKINDEGVWFRLSKVDNPELFIDNANKTINNKLLEQYGGDVLVSLFKLPRKRVLVFIPKKLFTSTYTVSLVTYVLRLCNYGETLHNFEHAISQSVACSTDQAIHNKGRSLALMWGFKVPVKYENYWYFNGDGYNSVVNPNPSYAGVIHNNGVMSWSMCVQ